VPALFRASAAERRRIREAAAREARMEVRSVVLQLGRRRSLTGRGSAFNIAGISDDPAFADTDFDDEYAPWSAFADGVALTADSKGIFDLAIRRRGDPDHDLQGHVTVYVEDRVVTRVCSCDTEY
jgi:hypothetical protein